MITFEQVENEMKITAKEIGKQIDDGTLLQQEIDVALKRNYLQESTNLNLYNYDYKDIFKKYQGISSKFLAECFRQSCYGQYYDITGYEWSNIIAFCPKSEIASV